MWQTLTWGVHLDLWGGERDLTGDLCQFARHFVQLVSSLNVVGICWKKTMQWAEFSKKHVRNGEKKSDPVETCLKWGFRVKGSEKTKKKPFKVSPVLKTSHLNSGSGASGAGSDGSSRFVIGLMQLNILNMPFPPPLLFFFFFFFPSSSFASLSFSAVWVNSGSVCRGPSSSAALEGRRRWAYTMRSLNSTVSSMLAVCDVGSVFEEAILLLWKGSWISTWPFAILVKKNKRTQSRTPPLRKGMKLHLNFLSMSSFVAVNVELQNTHANSAPSGKSW